ncbi:MAG: type II toxin-antitoxin system Phd/YefM family antitoxin [Reyranella sp.]|nr:type II toxin-antitoxin system Phd/YefM family antitoxin [Reyranella sp.]
MPTFSSTNAKNHSSELIDAAHLAPVGVAKYDKPFVVFMAVEEYERVMALGGAATQIGETKDERGGLKWP